MRALEDLRNQVRLRSSRRYVDEAIAAYGAGAYRSAVLSLWIAVVADVMAKIELLAERGEPAAVVRHAQLKAAVAERSRQMMQKFEHELLKAAHEELHLFGPREFDELQRLRDDRNLCAHPAFAGDDELFLPGPEQVRAHLAHAVDALFAHGAVPGRHARERFQRDVASPSFPDDDAKLEKYLNEGFLADGSPSLRRNLARLCVKGTLDQSLDAATRWRHTRVALALHRSSPTDFEDVAADLLAARQHDLDDDGLLRLAAGPCYLPFVWDTLAESTRDRIERLVETLPAATLADEYVLFDPLPAPPLDRSLLRRLPDVVEHRRAVRAPVELERPDRRLLPALEELLARSRSYVEAVVAVRWIAELAPALTVDDVRGLVDSALSSSQFRGSRIACDRLVALREQTVALLGTAEPWREFDAFVARTKTETGTEGTDVDVDVRDPAVLASPHPR